jgi:periplasmic protein TonB
MREQTTKREAGTNWVSAAYGRDRSRLGLALALLLVALTVLVVKDRDFWFGDAENTVASETSPEWNPATVIQVPPAAAPAQPKKSVVAATKSSAPAVAARPAVEITRSAVPPLEVEVIAGGNRNSIHLGSNPARVDLPPDSSSVPESSVAAERAPTTVASQRVQMSLAKATTPQRPDSSYPLLGRQMKVQGSVVLKALIGADGMIQDLRVISGPAILASAAREAAIRWQFKPYLQNGRPVETQANIAVNFTIKVLDNGVRDQMETVVALSRGGE